MLRSKDGANRHRVPERVCPPGSAGSHDPSFINSQTERGQTPWLRSYAFPTFRRMKCICWRLSAFDGKSERIATGTARQTTGPTRERRTARHRSAALPTKVSAVEMSAAAVERFVTDWQLQHELRPTSRLPFDREDIDHEDHDKDDSDDSEDEDTGKEEESFPADDDHQTDEDCDALYVDIGGEG